jgi:nucleoid-associated protein EbfC
MFKGLGNLASMIKQVQQMGAKLQTVQEELKKQRTVGRSGADLVEVEVNGLGQVLRITLDSALVARGDREMLEDLIPAAVNQALDKAKELHRDAMKELTGGMSLPPLDDLMSLASQAAGSDAIGTPPAANGPVGNISEENGDEDRKA